jgi:hypothetical protein
MAQDENLAALEKLAEAVSSGNLAVLDEVSAPNVVDHDPAPDQGPGRDGYARGPGGFVLAMTSGRTVFANGTHRSPPQSGMQILRVRCPNTKSDVQPVTAGS